jgi:hypothetical protein
MDMLHLKYLMDMLLLPWRMLRLRTMLCLHTNTPLECVSNDPVCMRMLKSAVSAKQNNSMIRNN